MYWQFEGDNRAWQMQLEQDNERAKLVKVQQQLTHALMAMVDHEVIGTIQIEPRASLTKLTNRMPYRDLGEASSVWSIGCLLVGGAHRRKGVGRALVLAAVEWTTSQGGRALEAYPRLGEDLRDDEIWTGPSELFSSLGFLCVREHMQYPVYRRELSLSSEK